MVLTVKDIVEPDYISLTPDTNALEAAKAMNEKHHGFLVVVSQDGKPLGIVTEWDFLSKIVAQGRDPGSVRLQEIMSTNLVSVKSSDGIDSVSKLMADRGIRRVLVTEDDKILGVITSKTILRNLKEYIDDVSTQIARLQNPPF